MDVTPDEFDEFFIGQEALYETAEDEWSPATITQLTHENPRDDVAVRRERYVVHLLPDDGGPLRMNARYSVRIVLDDSENTLVIPRAALREFDDRTYVRLLEGEARREVDVRVGIESQTKVEILEGLEEGDRVIGR
jgi:multidrug efflux pump subunit AcrA (membrane-fusion protein)